jgi:hypothetical protein
MRDFDVAGRGWRPKLKQSSVNHCLMVLGTAESTRVAWLRAGEALQRMMLEATRLGYVILPARLQKYRQPGRSCAQSLVWSFLHCY